MKKKSSKSINQSNRNTKKTNSLNHSNGTVKTTNSLNRSNSTAKNMNSSTSFNRNTKNMSSLNRSNSTVKNMNSLNQLNNSASNITSLKNSGIPKKSTMPDSRTSTSTTSTRTYTPKNRASVNTTTSLKQRNQKSSRNWGLVFTKLTIQVVLCILFYFAVYIIVTDYAGEAYDFAYQIFGDVCVEPSSDKKVKVTIPENASLKEIASLLADKELIKNEYSFYIRGKLSTNDKRVIMPGTYILYPSDNYEDILNTLTQSDNVE